MVRTVETEFVVLEAMDVETIAGVEVGMSRLLVELLQSSSRVEDRYGGVGHQVCAAEDGKGDDICIREEEQFCANFVGRYCVERNNRLK
jgi:hypothetical protein